ncbi:hypothetical protein, partial [Enterococcus faecalis]|uniref:hypothetical protein n=1 Tax=Enterococcus faecalis TaxID=1351 RepID=UPI003984ED16
LNKNKNKLHHKQLIKQNKNKIKKKNIPKKKQKKTKKKKKTNKKCASVLTICCLNCVLSVKKEKTVLIHCEVILFQF